MRFCQSFMAKCVNISVQKQTFLQEISRGAGEIGYLSVNTRELEMSLPEFLLVKVSAYGGSLIRPEATGYGVVYFGEQMLKTKGEDFKDKIVNSFRFR